MMKHNDALDESNRNRSDFQVLSKFDPRNNELDF